MIISTLTTLGLAVITGAVKYAASETLGQATLGSLDTIFGGIFGNVCHEGYNQIRQQLGGTRLSVQNADVERCSRDALLQALLTYSQEAERALSQTTLSEKDQQTCQYFLKKSREHFAQQLRKIATLPDTNPRLSKNPLASSDAFTQILAKAQQKGLVELKETLGADALREYVLEEFGYQPENTLYQQLSHWLTDGLPSGGHWFVYYVQALHANLKKNEPYYCQNARRILTQEQLADLSLLTRENLERLDVLMTLADKIETTVAAIQQQLDRIEEQNNQVLQQVQAHGVDIRAIRERLEQGGLGIVITSLTLNTQYQRLITQVQAHTDTLLELAAEQTELEEDLATEDGIRAERTRKRLRRVQQERWQVDAQRQGVREELAEFVQSVVGMAQKLSPSPDKDSDLLQQARERFVAGDYVGANAILAEDKIQAMVDEAQSKLREAAQAYLVKVEFVAAARQGSWLEESVRLCKRAVETYADADILFEVAYFLQPYNQYQEAVVYYRQCLQFPLTEVMKADTLNNLASLLADNPKERDLARAYYEEALVLRQELARQAPSVYNKAVADTLNNLANLLADDPKEYALARAYYKQALVLYKELDEQKPSVYKAPVANTLNNLANLLTDDPKERNLARKYLEESLFLQRKLIQQAPLVYTENTGRTLNNLANLLAKAPRQRNLALQYYQEALALYRELAQQMPKVYTDGMATTLNNLAILLAKDPSTRDLALTYHEEALFLRRELAQQTPLVYTAALADSLNNLGALLADDPLARDLALGYYEEALSLRRELAREVPSVYSAAVAHTLHRLANLLAIDLQGQNLALQYYEEALALSRELVRQKPSIYSVDMATMLHNLSIFYINAQPDYNKSMALVREAYAYFKDWPGSTFERSCQQIAKHWNEEL